jgi:hypothetical protein
VSDELKGKVSQTRCVLKVNVVVNLACFQSVPHRPLLAPIYRWPGLKEREGCYSVMAPEKTVAFS